jgi:DNA-directed RNA polymerase specialized sigma24 family protein
MTLNNWITQNYKENLQSVKNITKGSELTDDLYQECILILLEYKDPNKIQELINNNQLKYFFISIVIRQYVSTTSPFHTKYRKHAANTSDVDVYQMPVQDEEYDHDIDTLINYINKEKDTEAWYTKKMIELKFNENMSYRDISKMTGIPVTSCFNTINTFRKKVKNKYDGSKKN